MDVHRHALACSMIDDCKVSEKEQFFYPDRTICYGRIVELLTIPYWPTNTTYNL